MLPVLAGVSSTLLTPLRGAAAATALAHPKVYGVTPICSALPRQRRGSGAISRSSQQAEVRRMAGAAGLPSAAQFSIPAPQEHGNGKPGTMLEALEHLRETREDGEDLPTEYTVSEAERPTVRHDDWTEQGEIPLIDLSLAETDRAGIVRQLHSAAAEWGFFQLVNHGLSVEELDALQAAGRKFFGLSPEIKQKLAVPGKFGRSYIGDNTAEKGSALHWAESLMFQPEAMDERIGKFWQDGYQEFKDAVLNFSGRAEVINKQLLELLAEGLGLQTDFFSQHLNSRRTQSLRWNFYPACPRPEDVLGASSHTDGCSITLLVQDRVGGLQILKDGKWIGIRPIEGALVVNIGDTLHAWSNGIFKSVLHRAVVNESVHRLSIADFLSVDNELPISAPEELVDASHPRLYRPFNLGDYTRHILRTRYMNGDKHAPKDGLLVLDEFKLKK